MTQTTNRETEIAIAREVDERLSVIWSKFYDKRDQANDWSKRVRYTSNPKLRAEYDLVAATRLAEAMEFKNQALEIEKAEYTGWTRFYLVRHIHRTQNCSSFRITTRINWLPDVSGLTEDEAVAKYGHTLCTICFETAPVRN